LKFEFIANKDYSLRFSKSLIYGKLDNYRRLIDLQVKQLLKFVRGQKDYFRPMVFDKNKRISDKI